MYSFYFNFYAIIDIRGQYNNVKGLELIKQLKDFLEGVDTYTVTLCCWKFPRIGPQMFCFVHSIHLYMQQKTRAHFLLRILGLNIHFGCFTTHKYISPLSPFLTIQNWASTSFGLFYNSSISFTTLASDKNVNSITLFEGNLSVSSKIGNYIS